MTDAHRLSALLNIVDPDRSENGDESARLVVLGLGVRQERVFRPTSAGWNLLGDVGRPFDPQN